MLNEIKFMIFIEIGLVEEVVEIRSGTWSFIEFDWFSPNCIHALNFALIEQSSSVLYHKN